MNKTQEQPFRVVVEIVFPAGAVGNTFQKSIYKEIDFGLESKDSAKVVVEALSSFAQWINSHLCGLIEIKVGGLKQGIVSYSSVD